MRFALFQITPGEILGADTHLLRALAQDIILATTVSLAVASDLYRHVATIETATDLPEALEEIHLASAQVLSPATIVSSTSALRHLERSDLIVSEDGRAWVYQGTWFSPYNLALPAPTAHIAAAIDHDCSANAA